MDPVLRKEREWLQMAEDQKLQLQRPQDFFPKEEELEGALFGSVPLRERVKVTELLCDAPPTKSQ
jgi:hypothetical protein